MYRRARRFPQSTTPQRAPGRRPPGTTLFSGVYGLVPAGAAAHGRAHVVAHRMSADRGGVRIGLRAMPAERPVVAAAVPTALVLDTLLLAGWGVRAARSVGRGWATSLRAGTADMLIGLVSIVANALIEQRALLLPDLAAWLCSGERADLVHGDGQPHVALRALGDEPLSAGA